LVVSIFSLAVVILVFQKAHLQRPQAPREFKHCPVTLPVFSRARQPPGPGDIAVFAHRAAVVVEER